MPTTSDIRSIISDVASGRIKDDKIVALSGEVERLDRENTNLRLQVEVLTAKLSDLEAQFKNLQPPERIVAEAERVLNYAYDESAIFPRRKIETGLGVTKEFASHAINVLLVREFLEVVGRGSGSRGMTEMMQITPKGMHYAQVYLKRG
jgi:predicted RNase H-like nuclease (RuvC/YqgF family)